MLVVGACCYAHTVFAKTSKSQQYTSIMNFSAPASADPIFATMMVMTIVMVV